MPYYNASTDTWGHSIWDVRNAHPGVSIPDGIGYLQWGWYEPTPQPAASAGRQIIEARPANGVQQWSEVLCAPAEIRRQLHQALADEYESRMHVIAANYPASERESWPVQTSEARALLADPSASTPWIDAACASRQIERVELASRIVAKDEAYRAIHGALTGVRQRIEDQIDAAGDDLTALQAIDVAAGW